MKCDKKNWHEYLMVIRETIDRNLMYAHAACNAVVGRANMERLAKERNIDVIDLVICSRAFHGVQD